MRNERTSYQAWYFLLNDIMIFKLITVINLTLVSGMILDPIYAAICWNNYFPVYKQLIVYVDCF